MKRMSQKEIDTRAAEIIDKTETGVKRGVGVANDMFLVVGIVWWICILLFLCYVFYTGAR